MIIKYCPECHGLPYTRDTSILACPVCNSELLVEVITKESSLKNRRQIVSADYGNDDSSEISDPEDNNYYEEKGYDKEQNEEFNLEDDEDCKSDLSREMVGRSLSTNVSNSGLTSQTGKVIKGRVINYKCSSDEGGEYHRLYIQKIYELLMYGQKTEDVLHRFVVHSNKEDGYGYTQSSDTPVNVHGSITNGLSISDNCEVEVKGKFNGNRILMARDIYITSYGGRTKVNFRHDPKCIADFVFVLISLILTMITLVRYDGSFSEGVSVFIKALGVMFVIYTVLYIFLFRRFLVLSAFLGKSSFSLTGVFLLSFISTLLFMNRDIIFAGSGSAITGFLQSFITTIIFLAVIVFLIKLIIKF